MQTCKSEACSFFLKHELYFFLDYFDMDRLKSLNFIEFVTILLLPSLCLFVCLFWPQGMWGLSSLMWD